MPKSKPTSSRALKQEYEESTIILSRRPKNTEHAEAVWDEETGRLKVVYEKNDYENQ